MRWRSLREWFRPRPAVSAARYVQNTIPKWDKATLLQIIDAQVSVSGGYPGHNLGGVNIQ